LIAAACYMAFGYGYIIPATFLPRWRAATSTIRDLRPDLAGVRRRRGGLPLVSRASDAAWALHCGHGPVVLTAGVLLPALTINLATLLLSASAWEHLQCHHDGGIRDALRLGSAPARSPSGDDRQRSRSPDRRPLT